MQVRLQFTGSKIVKDLVASGILSAELLDFDGTEFNTFPSLVGLGSRVVMASASGELSATGIPIIYSALGNGALVPDKYLVVTINGTVFQIPCLEPLD